MEILAGIGVLALLAWFIRAIGLKSINLKFDNKPINWRTGRSLNQDEKPPKQLSK